MGLFKHNSETIQEENGELKKNLAELDCEDTIINEKEQFGRVRNSMMQVLRAKYGNDLANRVLSRINKRFQKHHFDKYTVIKAPDN